MEKMKPKKIIRNPDTSDIPFQYRPHKGAKNVMRLVYDGLDKYWFYLWEIERNGKPVYYLYISTPKRKNSALVFEYSRRSLDVLLDRANEVAGNLAYREEQKRKRRAQSRGANRHVEVGDIFVSTWGYDQTNVDFYEVVGKRGTSTVVIRKVGKKTVKSSQTYDYVVPRPGVYTGSPIKVRVKFDGKGPYISTRKIPGEFAWKWDGRLQYETNPMYGH